MTKPSFCGRGRASGTGARFWVAHTGAHSGRASGKVGCLCGIAKGMAESCVGGRGAVRLGEQGLWPATTGGVRGRSGRGSGPGLGFGCLPQHWWG